MEEFTGLPASESEPIEYRIGDLDPQRMILYSGDTWLIITHGYNLKEQLWFTEIGNGGYYVNRTIISADTMVQLAPKKSNQEEEFEL